MTTDILSLTLSGSTSPAPTRTPAVRPVTASLRQGLAHAYLAAYPPQVGAADLQESLEEIDRSLSGAYGALRDDASAAAVSIGEDGERVLGAVLVTERSLWDEWLEGPFVIDLFVTPSARGRGIGAGLLRHAVEACRAAGDDRLSLRTGEGTSAAAAHLYDSLGFMELEPRR